MQHSRRIAVSLALTGATTITLFGVRSSLSAATTAVANVISATCHDSVACIRLVNAGTGVVISAEAPKNNAIVGITDLTQTGLDDLTHYAGGVVGVNKTRIPGGKTPPPPSSASVVVTLSG